MVRKAATHAENQQKLCLVCFNKALQKKTNWSEEPVDSQRQKPQKPAIFGAIFIPGCESGANLPNPHPPGPLWHKTNWDRDLLNVEERGVIIIRRDSTAPQDNCLLVTQLGLCLPVWLVCNCANVPMCAWWSTNNERAVVSMVCNCPQPRALAIWERAP